MTESETIRKYEEVRDLFREWEPETVVESLIFRLNSAGEIDNFNVLDYVSGSTRPMYYRYAALNEIARFDGTIPCHIELLCYTIWPGEICCIDTRPDHRDVIETSPEHRYMTIQRNPHIAAMLFIA